MPIAAHIVKKMDESEEFDSIRLVDCLTEDEDDDILDAGNMLPDESPTFRLTGASPTDDASRLEEVLTNLGWVVSFVIPPEGEYTCWRCDFDPSNGRIYAVPDIEKRAAIALIDTRHAVAMSFHGPVECDLTWSDASDPEFSLLVLFQRPDWRSGDGP